MMFESHAAVIRWRIHLKTPMHRVFRVLTTDDGRGRFWAESAIEKDGTIDFRFPNGMTWCGEILESAPPRRFSVKYLGGSTVTFELANDGIGGTDVTLTDEGVPSADRAEVIAGWVSVLMTLKAAVDFGVDLRNHDSKRTWDEGFADN
jgi:uncharacterized protein YndB with AHSA1/START domain